MKVLFDHHDPFILAHGGTQIQIEQTKNALASLGVEVEFLRWWDDKQQGDLIHFYINASNTYLQRARTMKLPVVLTSLFTDTCNRSDARLACQGWLTRMILAMPFGEGVKQQLTWRSYNNCTHNVVGLEAERHVLQTVYRVPSNRISIVPYGLSEGYLQAGHGRRNESHLICTGIITQRKNCVELAEMAHAAQTPIPRKKRRASGKAKGSCHGQVYMVLVALYDPTVAVRHRLLYGVHHPPGDLILAGRPAFR